MRIVNAPVTSITIPDNYPRNTQKIAEILPSLKAQFLLYKKREIPLNPILVSARKKNEFVLVNGLKRLAAAKDSGEATIPALIVPAASSTVMMFTSSITDDQSNPIEKARSIQQLKQLGLPLNEIALLAGFGQAGRMSLNLHLRLLTLPQQIINFIEDGRLNLAQSIELLGIPDDLAIRLASYTVEDDLSVSMLKEIKSRWLKTSNRNTPIAIDDRLKDNEQYNQVLKLIYERLGVTGDFRFSDTGLKLTLDIHTVESFSKFMDSLSLPPEEKL